MKQEVAVKIIRQAVEMAAKAGVYSLQDASTVNAALATLEQDTPASEEELPVVDTDEDEVEQ